VQRQTILTELSVLESELQTLENEVATSTPVVSNNPNSQFVTTNPNNIPNFEQTAVIASTTEEIRAYDENCAWKINYWGRPYYQCLGG
jgi:hypothetical protein